MSTVFLIACVCIAAARVVAAVFRDARVGVHAGAAAAHQTALAVLVAGARPVETRRRRARIAPPGIAQRAQREDQEYCAATHVRIVLRPGRRSGRGRRGSAVGAELRRRAELDAAAAAEFLLHDQGRAAVGAELSTRLLRAALAAR